MSNKVLFTHRRGGREQVMPRRYAEILTRLGRGTYRTRAVSPAAPVVTHAPVVRPPVEPHAEATEVSAVYDEPAPDLDDMTAAQLREYATILGVEVPPKSSAGRIRSILRRSGSA